jgi:tetratricopeptide (TPR) repeat protein
MGRIDEAIRLCAEAIEQDPTSAPGYARQASFLLFARRWDESIAANRMALVLSPGHGGLRAYIGTALLIGKRDAAGALAEIRAEPDELGRASLLPLPLYALGRTQEADAALTDLVAKHAKDAAYSVAAVHAYRGQTDQAFAWLDRCVANEEPGAVSMLLDPLFDSLHKDPRWVPMLRHFGVAPEQLAKIHFELPPGVGKATP